MRAGWGRSVDLVDEVLVLVCVDDCCVEPPQQRVEGLTLAADEHGQALRVIGRRCDALADGVEMAESDLAATLYQRGDVLQGADHGARQRCGSNSSTRLAGCVGSRSSTSRRYM